MILADVSNTINVSATVICALATLGCFIFMLSSKSSKREVTIIPDGVSKVEFAALKEKTDDLNDSNTEAWKQMERNRMECRDRIAKSDETISALKATIEALTNSVNLLTLELHNSRNKKS